MTTTDPFTTAAREEAVKAGIRCPVHGIPDCSPLLNGCSIPTTTVQGRVHMAEWARTYLAAQRPTDAECIAVLDVTYGPLGPHDEPYDDEDMAEARTALTAARAVRGQS